MRSHTSQLVPLRLRIVPPAAFDASHGREPTGQTPTRFQRIPSSKPDFPLALDLYPDHSDLIGRLRRVGITQVFGIFDLSAWRATLRAAQLYRLPLAGEARADLRRLIDEASARTHSSLLYLSGLAGWERQTKRITATVMRDYEAEGTLLPTIFPNFEEWPVEQYKVRVTYPAIPRDIWHLAHRASLAGGTLEVAAPAEAVRVDGIEDAVAAHVQRRALDPIVTMRVAETIVVLGRYGEAEAPAMITLVEVLEGLAVRL